MQVITTKNLVKDFPARSFSNDKIRALNNFSFEVSEGEIFGLLGPNGAGKTTLVKILLGIVSATEGEAKVFGKDVTDVSFKSKVGYLPENHKFPNYLTGEQVLHYFGKLSGMDVPTVRKRTNEYLGLVEMEKWRNTKIKKYSKGMMQRLGLAQSMINNPDLIFLDEPTDGVDPIGRKEIRDVLLNLKSEGKTIFLNSHLLSEIELICDRVAILNKGELVRQGSIDELTAAGNTYKFTTNELAEDVMNSLLNEYKAVLHGKVEFLYNSESIENVNKLIDFLRGKGVVIQSMAPERNSLESMFINIIGQQQN